MIAGNDPSILSAAVRSSSCLGDDLTKDGIEPLSAGIVAWVKKLAPAVDTRVVFKDSGFADDIAKTNMAAILNQNGISDVRSL